VAALELADAPLRDEDDVIDPAGGEEAVYAACVTELWELCQRLIALL
jgi:protein-tyrosine-phosphatase